MGSIQNTSKSISCIILYNDVSSTILYIVMLWDKQSLNLSRSRWILWIKNNVFKTFISWNIQRKFKLKKSWPLSSLLIIFELRDFHYFIFLSFFVDKKGFFEIIGKIDLSYLLFLKNKSRFFIFTLWSPYNRAVN